MSDQATVSVESLASETARVEAVIRKLLKDVKRYTDAVYAIQKMENKCVADLLQSPICAKDRGGMADPELKKLVRHWSSSMDQLGQETKQLANMSRWKQKHETDDLFHVLPTQTTMNLSDASAIMSRLKLSYLKVLSGYHAGVHKHQALLQEHAQALARWNKVEKEGRFSVTSSRLNQLKNHLAATSSALSQLETSLQRDLSTLQQQSQLFFQPLLSSFAQSQLHHEKASYDILTRLLADTGMHGQRSGNVAISERSLDNEMAQLRGQLSALSIVGIPSDR